LSKKICVMLRDDGPTGYYRVTLPYSRLFQKSSYQIEQISSYDNPSLVAKKLDCDVFVIPRMHEPVWIETCKALRKANKTRIVIDHDDNMFSVSPLSNHYVDFGTSEVEILSGKSRQWLWRDGENGFDVKANVEKYNGFCEALSVADMVTVTQPVLGDLYKEYNENIKVLPNCLDFSLWKKAPMKPHDEVRLFWSGGSSHFEDWCLLEDVLPVVMSKYPDVHLYIQGTAFHGTLKNCPQERVHVNSWAPYQALPYICAIRDPDIAIIPLRENEFNACKSNIKWVEMSALGVPCVISNVDPYKVNYDGSNAVMIENNSSDGWIEGISTLVEDKILRSRIAGEALRYVKDNFDIDSKFKLWEDSIEDLDSWRSPTPLTVPETRLSTKPSETSAYLH